MAHTVSLGDRGWHVETIWRAASGLPVHDLPLETIPELDTDCWFNGHPPTVRAIIDHTRRIQEADLTRPVILSAGGQVLDGMHRIAKAVLIGRATVPAQRLPADPEPDWCPEPA
ncbi:hypothetical protein [Paractinoplanes lichenicola]|uniref:Uncharacterized protein n=1 Tax=Paractinoplanes lichenicola TaxID=2802976 RepID=A0ABS1VYJ0_9ACTN|nr:hypothetical protein [Actinoplanes lichenicola]MBL7259564.1 hypothetical protein [Actinoplanes lichenicola]